MIEMYEHNNVSERGDENPNNAAFALTTHKHIFVASGPLTPSLVVISEDIWLFLLYRVYEDQWTWDHGDTKHVNFNDLHCDCGRHFA